VTTLLCAAMRHDPAPQIVINSRLSGHEETGAVARDIAYVVGRRLRVRRRRGQRSDLQRWLSRPSYL